MVLGGVARSVRSVGFRNEPQQKAILDCSVFINPPTSPLKRDGVVGVCAILKDISLETGRKNIFLAIVKKFTNLLLKVNKNRFCDIFNAAPSAPVL
jgi:hypothetical protein